MKQNVFTAITLVLLIASCWLHGSTGLAVASGILLGLLLGTMLQAALHSAAKGEMKGKTE